MARMTYVQGTSARNLRQKERINERQRQRVNQRVRKNREKALQMNLGYIFLLSIAVVCTLFICVQYIQVQSSISGRLNNIKKLEKELAAWQAENDALEMSINTSVDLDYIYQVATEELGMVSANKSQTRLYNRTESEYVRQNEDIPAS